jgi:hypothetical protein
VGKTREQTLLVLSLLEANLREAVGFEEEMIVSP